LGNILLIGNREVNDKNLIQNKKPVIINTVFEEYCGEINFLKTKRELQFDVTP